MLSDTLSACLKSQGQISVKPEQKKTFAKHLSQHFTGRATVSSLARCLSIATATHAYAHFNQ